MAKDANTIVSARATENLIYQVRGQRVMLDSDVAVLYGVQTKALNQAVRRNLERFPEDFMFRLTWKEVEGFSRSQSVTLNSSQSHRGRNIKYQPFVFTEQGVAMLSSVLRSPRAVQVNVEIMRAFVRLRQWLASNAELAARLNKLEQSYDRKFKVVFEAIRELMREKTTPKRKREIGFHAIQVSPPKPVAKSQERISV